MFGQGGSFTTNACNNGGVSASSLCADHQLALDGSGNVYITDSANNRVLEYDHPTSIGKYIYVPHGTNVANVSQIDPVTNSIVGTVALSHGHDIAFLPDGSRAYVPDAIVITSYASLIHQLMA